MVALTVLRRSPRRIQRSTGGGLHLTSENDRALRKAFGRFATGVTVATTRNSQGAPIGLTVNSFSSVSLDPPLSVWSLDRKASAFQAFTSSGFYGVSVLAQDQRDICEAFAMREGPRFQIGAWEDWETGAPILADALAAFDCRMEAVHEAGDHVMLLGRIVRFRVHPDRVNDSPLMFFASRFWSDLVGYPEDENA